MQSTCTTCPRPVPDTAYGCLNCATSLAGTMGQLAGIVHELDTTVSKQDRLGSGGARGKGHAVPLPYNVGASERAAAIVGELVTWAQHVIGETARKAPSGHPAAAAAYLLAASTNWLRYRQEWAEAYEALSPLAKEALRVIDRPADRQYAGPCWADLEGGGRCEAELYAKDGARSVECRDCEAEHDVADRRLWLIAEAQDVLATAATIAAGLTSLNQPVTSSMIRNYAGRGRIVAHGQDRNGRPTYRVGDVLQVLLEAALRKAGVAA
jgi:hypothetical protein